MRSTDSRWLPVFFFSAFMIELQTKSSFRKKGFLLHAPLPLPCPSPREDRAGSIAETMGGTVLTDFLSLASSTTFLAQPGPTAQKWHCPWWTVSSHISIKKEKPHPDLYKACLLEAIPIFPLLNWLLNYITVDWKTNNIKAVSTFVIHGTLCTYEEE